MASTGAPADLDAAISFAIEAASLTPRADIQLASRLDTIGIRLSQRFSHIGVAADLDEAILFAAEAIRLTPSDHPARPGRLERLVIRLAKRYIGC
ncbi:hypothetical protein O9K51_10897 [Purpureocillium lavendulum]|uniref:Uncharacterized protein n=1 Tax=Purpureocillium lavendulum TaxID=1247861 RepID=A0AB34FCH4_9HYPO|nr:hypothetical protein O9K51_10897 [Purpureocillium lavendulum]